MKKIYYKLNLKLLSPLALGSGSGDVIDKNVAVDSSGNPYIPASTLAGFFKSLAPKDIRKELFGEIENGAVQSLIYTYDAVLAEDSNAKITVRDSVALDEHKISKKGEKFDFEAVETDAKFVTYVELHDPNGKYEATVDSLIASAQKFSVGAKTTRGYGKIEITEARKRVFDMTDKSSAKDWLDFDLFDKNAFEGEKAYKLDLSGGDNGRISICASLNLMSAITIRKYTTGYLKDKNGEPKRIESKKPEKNGKIIGDADFQQLTLRDNTPVIPGTSWAGAFKHRMKKLADELGMGNQAESILNGLFGYVDIPSKTSQKSKIYFGESQISGANEKVISRTSIDRFTGSSANTALFTERVFFGGETQLEIEIIRPDESMQNDMRSALKLLFIALEDLHNGLLAIGGQTSVGSGLFEVKSLEINGNDLFKEFCACDFDACIEEALK